MRPRRMLAALAALSASATAAAADPSGPAIPRLETRDEAIARDALEYARRYAMPHDQAVRELRAQIESVPVTDAIAREFAARLVGIAITHAPHWQIEVLLTGDAPVPDRTSLLGDIEVPIVFRTGAAATHSEIVSAITAHQAQMRAALTTPPGIGVDVRTGELVVLVGSRDADRDGVAEIAGRFAVMTGVPVRVEISGAPVNMAVGGGSRVVGSHAANGQRFVCTSGFAVTDGARIGIATAAHCPDELSYVGPDRVPLTMPFVSQHGWGYQDVQINASSTPLSPWFYSDTAKTLVRPVEAGQSRAGTRAGDFVCHRGERTGYSCAEVLMTDFAPAGDLCGGACLPTWVAVEGPTCQGGDSGAPVFSGTSALGLVKGGTYRADRSCAMFYYMSVDYLPRGWTLLQSTPRLDRPIAPAADREAEAAPVDP